MVIFIHFVLINDIVHSFIEDEVLCGKLTKSCVSISTHPDYLLVQGGGGDRFTPQHQERVEEDEDPGGVGIHDDVPSQSSSRTGLG